MGDIDGGSVDWREGEAQTEGCGTCGESFGPRVCGYVGVLVLFVVARCAVGRGVSGLLPAGLLSGELHVDHGVSEAFIVAQGHNSVIEILHYASFGSVELLMGPHATTPGLAIVLRRFLGILGKLDGND